MREICLSSCLDSKNVFVIQTFTKKKYVSSLISILKSILKFISFFIPKNFINFSSQKKQETYIKSAIYRVNKNCLS